MHNERYNCWNWCLHRWWEGTNQREKACSFVFTPKMCEIYSTMSWSTSYFHILVSVTNRTRIQMAQKHNVTNHSIEQIMIYLKGYSYKFDIIIFVLYMFHQTINNIKSCHVTWVTVMSSSSCPMPPRK